SLVFFFFSSRRRHTRSYGDWSSDVCSSDLGELERAGRPGLLRPGREGAAGPHGRGASGPRTVGQDPAQSAPDSKIAPPPVKVSEIGRAAGRERDEIAWVAVVSTVKIS